MMSFSHQVHQHTVTDLVDHKLFHGFRSQLADDLDQVYSLGDAEYSKPAPHRYI